jgi:FkbM family methyltransferase
MILQNLFAHLWWGPFRRIFEAFSRRIWGKSEKIISGPARGKYIQGGLAAVLGIYEYPIQQILLEYIRPGDVIYDIGANQGYFSLLASILTGATGHVYAFEPFPDNIRFIEQVISRNNLGNCTLISKAVSGSSSLTDLYFSETNSATPSLFSNTDTSSIQVSTVSLDEFILEFSPPTYVKLDVEGSEIAVLNGASQLFSQTYPPVWIIEIHNLENECLARDILHDAGYTVDQLSSLKRNTEMYPLHILAKKSIP